MNDKIESLLNFVEKNLGPIVVQECKQILHMRRYTILFILYLIGLLCCGFLIMDSQDVAVGMVLVLLTMLITVVYPLQIITTNSTSWSKDKLDMIKITAIQPVQIVWGRLVAGSFISTLVVILATPFLSLGYLVPGTDLLPLLIVLGLVVLCSVVTVMVTIYAAWMMEEYSFAPLLKVVYMLFLLQVGIGCSSMFVVFLENLDQTEMWQALFSSIGIAVWLLIQLFTRTVLWLRHPTENKTTLLKVLDVMNIAIGLGIFCFPNIFEGNFGFQPISTSSWAALTILFFVGGVLSPYLLESSTLPRRALLNVHQYVTKNRFWLPWLPGPGMGMVFFGICISSLSLFFESISYTKPTYIPGSFCAMGCSAILFWFGLMYVQKIFLKLGWKVKPMLIIAIYLLIWLVIFAGCLQLAESRRLASLEPANKEEIEYYLFSADGLWGLIYPALCVGLGLHWVFLKDVVRKNIQDIYRVFDSIEKNSNNMDTP